MTARGMVVGACVGAVVVGALALTAYPSRRLVSVARNAQPEALAQPVHVAAAALTEARPAPPVAAVEPTHVPRAIVEKPKQPLVLSSRNSPAVLVPLPSPPVAAATGAEQVSSETVARERSLAAPAVASTTIPDAVSQAVVTMRGCLETTVDQDQFRLTDTEGADTPRARSWRSGFLKKRSTPVDLVELSDPVGLRKYVGHHVVATGVLTGRELRVRSLQAAGTSCN